MKLIEFMGAPGSGKSTIAAELFAALKRAGVNCELVREVAKDLAWAGALPLTDQGYVMEMQRRRYIEVFNGGCEVLVSDTSLLLSSFYNGQDPAWIWGQAYPAEPYVFHVSRTKAYNPKGRLQTEAESDALAASIQALAEVHRFDMIDSHTLGASLVGRLGL